MIFKRFCRIFLFFIIIVTLASLLNYVWNGGDIYKRYSFKIEEIADSKFKDDLTKQIDELQKTKESLNNELKVMEEKKTSVMSEVNKYEDTLEKTFTKISEMELTKKKLETEMGDIRKQKSDSYSTLDTCFQYSKCKINSKIKVYFFENTILKLTKTIDTVYDVVGSPEEACLTIKFISSVEDAQTVYKSVDTIKANNNLLIINLLDDFNLFDPSPDISYSTLDSLKCSILASFNYYSNNEVLSNRYNNLFMHFSLTKANINDNLVPIYENQKQNRLLLTYRRPYLITYYLTENEKINEKLGKNKNYNQINCNAKDGKCLSMLNRLELLSNASYLLIENNYATNSTLWSTSLTERLIESLSVGTVPLILDLDSKLPLSEFLNWDEIVIRLSASQLSNLDSILRGIHEADLINRRIRAVKVFKRYFQTADVQFNTLITALRERLRLPAIPIDDYIVEGIDDIPQVGKVKVNMSLYTDLSTQINDDENLGPVTKDAAVNALHQSKSFEFNMTLNTYSAWNQHFYPFKLMPSTPFDKFLPIDLKYTSISTPTNPDKHYYYGGTRGGEYFSEKLYGNHDDNEQFTIIILTFNRERLLINVLLEYFKLPFLNQIIVVWNSAETKPTEAFYYIFKTELNTKLLRIVFGKLNSLGNRFLPYDFIKTDAVMSLDDDTQLRNDEIIFAFRTWRENRDRLVGFPARFHSWEPTTQTFRYKTDLSCEYSLILTGAAIYHRYYHYYYHYILDNRIREKIDEFMNCEDIAFNFMISDLTRKPPLKVTTKSSFNCKLCAEMDIQKSLSSNALHYERRSICINYFNLIYGYNPLLYSQARSDSVLYYTNVPRDQQTCFRNV